VVLPREGVHVWYVRQVHVTVAIESQRVYVGEAAPPTQLYVMVTAIEGMMIGCRELLACYSFVQSYSVSPKVSPLRAIYE
jgi:hypothetical protein